jgi:demethylmenaquinone methyltransferase/2-methoxy-6-polyprenyl-1,4-benzoquinol methylase
MDSDRILLDEQIRYYRERAGEYDEWFLRQGRYDRGLEHKRRWFGEVKEVREALEHCDPRGDVLEYACGTGIWTEQLVKRAVTVTAVDAAPEAIVINRSRLEDPRVEYVVSDIFTWEPKRRYDFVFFGFWLSHVPPNRFGDFWCLVEQALKPGGRVFLVDSRFTPESTAVDHSLASTTRGTVERRLNDGRQFTVIKVFHDAAELERRLGRLGWIGKMTQTTEFFIHGSVERQGVAG